MPRRVADRDVADRLRTLLDIGPNAITPTATHAGAETVRDYLADYTGRAFNTYGRNIPIAITSDDLIAVTMLSISINNARASLHPSAILALRDRSDRIEELLRQLPTDRALHTLNRDEADGWLSHTGSAHGLYRLLHDEAGIPRVAAHKLLARKRPLLIPVRDTKVEAALGLTSADNGCWWQAWWSALNTHPDIVAGLHAIGDAAEAPHLPLLRVADIVIWMRAMSSG